MKNESVTALMSKNVISIDIREPLSRAQALMQQYHIRHLPVLKKGKLVGILSLTDLMRLSFSDNFGELESDADVAIFKMLGIRHIMKSAPETLAVTQSIRDAADVLADREFHALPVVDGEEVVGMVTSTDLIRYLLQCMEE